MDQDATWYRGRAQPGHVRWGTQLPLPCGKVHSTPNFRSLCLYVTWRVTNWFIMDAACVRKLWPMSIVAKRMDQDATRDAFNTGAIGVMHRRPLQRQAR